MGIPEPRRYMDEAAMAIVLGTRRDWATWIGPLIPRSDLLEAQAHNIEVGPSSARVQEDPSRE